MTLYTESNADQTDHFPLMFFFLRKRYIRLRRCDDVMTFESLQPPPFCLEKSSVRKGIFLSFTSIFSADLDCIW